MILKRKITRTEQWKRNFLKSQLLEFENPAEFSKSTKRHLADPVTKQRAMEKARRVRNRLEKRKNLVEV